MTATEIETKRMEVLRQINEKREQLNTVSIRVHELEKELVELKEKKRLGRHTLSVLGTENEILQSEYWRTRQ